MTDNLLTAAIARKCKEAVKNLQLASDDGSTDRAEVSVYEGFLPINRKSGESYPFLCVRPVSGVIDDEGGASCEVHILCGVWREDRTGYQEAMNMSRVVMQSLASMPNRLLEEQYTIDGNIEWELDEEQYHPAWAVTVKTRWIFRGVEIIAPETF